MQGTDALMMEMPKPQLQDNAQRIRYLLVHQDLPKADLRMLLTSMTESDEAFLYENARKVQQAVFGKSVYLRGLIEISNYCRNDCYYCGIRRSNKCAQRYRLTQEEILECCRKGYALGFRTFVLQGGEDSWFTDARMCEVTAAIRTEFPDCAITLSLGERSEESYRALHDAGADRYLLRHETADEAHYRMLHPEELSLLHRKACLHVLKKIGYQVGCGMMIGSPGQTVDHLLEDLKFMKKLKPHMVGIGPFIPHKDTPFAGAPAGTLKDTLHLLGIIRLMFPKVLLPATTALGTIAPNGRELGILAGANVIMPNLSPADVREKYLLYDGKVSSGSEAAENCRDMQLRMQNIGYQVVSSRGDAPK